MKQDSPHQLYRHYDKSGQLLYVGISLSAVGRLAGHRDGAHWYHEIANVKIEIFPSKKDAQEAERQAVLTEKPLHNKHLRKAKKQPGGKRGRPRKIVPDVKPVQSWQMPDAPTKVDLKLIGLDDTLSRMWEDRAEFLKKQWVWVEEEHKGKKKRFHVPGWRLTSFDKASERTGLDAAVIAALEREGKFPRSFRLHDNARHKVFIWGEVEAWAEICLPCLADDLKKGVFEVQEISTAA